MKTNTDKLFVSLLLIVLIFYSYLSNVPVQWGDSGYYLTRIIEGPFLGLSLHPMGHPFFQVILKIAFSIFGINGILFFNVFCLGLNIMVLYNLAQRLQSEKKPDLRYLLGIMPLHAVVWTTTHVEVYQLHLLLLLTSIYFIFDPKQDRFFVSGLFLGLSLCVHQMSILAFPIVAFWILRYYKKIKFILFFIGFIMGSIFLFPSFYKNFSIGPINEIKLFFTGATSINKGWESNLFSFNAFSKSSIFFILAALTSILNPSTIIFFKYNKKNVKEMLLLKFLGIAFIFFAFSYQVSDKFTFLLPFLSISALFSSLVGIESNWLSSSKLLFYYLLPIIITGCLVINKPNINAKTYELKNTFIRDETLYYGFPWIKNHSAFEYSQLYFSLIKEKHPIYTDYNIKSCFNSYQLYLNGKIDFKIVSSIKELSGTNDSIFLIPRLSNIDTSFFKRINLSKLGYVGILK